MHRSDRRYFARPSVGHYYCKNGRATGARELKASAAAMEFEEIHTRFALGPIRTERLVGAEGQLSFQFFLSRAISPYHNELPIKVLGVLHDTT